MWHKTFIICSKALSCTWRFVWYSFEYFVQEKHKLLCTQFIFQLFSQILFELFFRSDFAKRIVFGLFILRTLLLIFSFSFVNNWLFVGWWIIPSIVSCLYSWPSILLRTICLSRTSTIPGSLLIIKPRDVMFVLSETNVWYSSLGLFTFPRINI